MDRVGGVNCDTGGTLGGLVLAALLGLRGGSNALYVLARGSDFGGPGGGICLTGSGSGARWDGV